MLRRLVGQSRGLIVHSTCVEEAARAAGFEGPIARIPHGAWIPEGDRMAARHKLGLGETTPLIGIFGFLKPYKRIAESLRAFRRLLKEQPDAKMILVGEPHPELPLERMIETLGLDRQVRVLGFAPMDEFVQYIAACDIVLNLRHPTVGENSGTLMRALGLGKAVIVSDTGSFRELPDAICLKTPIDRSEENCLFEYLRLLVSRPDLARTLGANAREWVEKECSWSSVAHQYVTFLEDVTSGKAVGLAPAVENIPQEPEPERAPPVDGAYILGWSKDEAGRRYAETHLSRLVKTLEVTPAGGPDDRILEMGVYLQITPALKYKLGYGDVRGCYFGQAGRTEHRRAASTDGEEFSCDVDLFNAEKDRYPYPDEHFATVLCCELIEHLSEDPMFLMSEVNRILKPGGHLVLTTPNIASLRALAGILGGHHPGFFTTYIRPNAYGEIEARHNREYAPSEIALLFQAAGFETALLDTGEFREEPHPEYLWVTNMLDRYHLSKELRGDGIFAVGRKTGPVRERHPAFLYS
jgi:SAM-dependent methyltransferase